MSARYDQTDANDDWDGDDIDPEGPQECDLVEEDDEETPTVPCPACHRPIPDFVDRCPYCGDWVVQSAGRSQRSTWIVIAAVLALAAFLAWTIL